MTLLEELQSHRGGLIRIKSQLYWYDGRGQDGFPGRICLVLDAAATAAGRAAVAAATSIGIGPTALITARYPAAPRTAAAALLLIDGCPQWIWVCQEDVELIT